VAIGVPAVLLVIGYAIASLLSFWKKALSKRGNVFSQIATLITVGLILAYVIPVVIDRMAADYSICPWNNLYDYPTFRDKMLKIGGLKGEKVILNVGDDKKIQAMYYTGSLAYSDVPSPDEIIALIEKGYRPYIVIDARLRNVKRIRALLKDAVLKNQITLVGIPRPQAFVAKHPYVN
jgi:hypothetical protein